MARSYIHQFAKKKEVILFIYDYACQSCGLISTSNHVHHIDSNPQNNDVFNLCPLCSDCHKLVHKLHIVLLPQLDPLKKGQLLQLQSHWL